MNVPIADWKPTRYQKRLVKKVLKSGRLTYGDVTRELESKFAEIHGWGYAIFLSSGTDALKIALHALKDANGWKDGDEVIIPALTFIATFNVVLMNNLKPVLVDIDADLNIDPTEVEKAITEKTVAIMPVHMLGKPAPMKQIKEIAKKHNLKVVEDSCEMMFTPVSKGDVACYSTYMAHLMSTGVGGFICTNNKQLATDMRSLMNHGRDESYLNIDDIAHPKSRYNFPRSGYSDRATEMEAALGLGELKKHDRMMFDRRRNTRYLSDALNGFGDDYPFMFPFTDSTKRDQLMLWLEDRGVQTRTIMPLTNQPIVEKFYKGKVPKFPIADWVNETGLIVGCHQYLKRKQLDHIIKSVEEFYEVSSHGK